MPVLDFSDIEEQEKLTPALAPVASAPLDFSDIEESDRLEPATPSPAPGLSFDDIVADVANLPPGEGEAPNLDPATYIQGAAPSFQMSPAADEDPFPDITAGMQEWQKRRESAGTWANINEPLITEEKRKGYSDWLAKMEGKIPTSLDPTGMRSLLEQAVGPEEAGKIRAGVTKGAAELAYGFTSPLGIGTLGFGVLPKAAQKAAAAGFAVDMARHLPDAVEAIGTAQGPEAKAQAITQAIGSAGMIGLLGKHIGGRGEAGGAGPRIVGSEGPRRLLTPQQIAELESVAPETAKAASAPVTPPPLPTAAPEATSAPAAPAPDLSPERFTLRKQAEAQGDQIVWVDPAKFEPAFQKDVGFYVGEGGEGGIKGRYEGFAEWQKEGKPIEVPEVSIQPDGRAAFHNGRHRYAWLRDQGMGKVPMAMEPESRARAKELGFFEEPPAPAEPAPAAEPPPFVPPETNTTLDPVEYPAVRRPIEGLEVSMKELPQFKSDADPVTGEVKGQELKGPYDHLAGGNIIEWVRNDGRRIVASGRHRFNLAKRAGEKTINTIQVLESEGWTPERVSRLDAELNIKDEKGTVFDFANYFRGRAAGREGAEERGLLARTPGKRGFKIGTLASDDLFARFQAERLSEQHALAIVEAAGSNAAAQRVGMRYAESHPRATMEEVGNRTKAATLVEAAPDASAQGEFWDSGDSLMAAMDKAAETAAKFQAEKASDIRTLTAALGKSDELKLTPNEAKKFKIQDPNSVISIRKALEKLKMDAAAWENWHLDPGKTAAVLEKSGTAKEFVKSGPPEADAKAWAEAAGARFDRVDEGGSYQFTIMDQGKESTLYIPARNVTAESILERVKAKREEMSAPTITNEADLDAFFRQMGMEVPPAPPAPLPKPEGRAKAADVTFTELPRDIVEVPEGALSVSKAKLPGTGTTVTLVEYPDRIEIKDLVSLQEGQGGGSAVIEAVQAKGKPIELVAGRRPTDTPIEELTQFYRNRGFTEVEGSPGRFRWEPAQAAEQVSPPGPSPAAPSVEPAKGKLASDAGEEVVRLPNEKYPDTAVPLLEIMVREKDGQFQHFTSANVHDVGIGHPWSKGFASKAEAISDAVGEIRRFLPEARKRKGMSKADLKRLEQIEAALPAEAPVAERPLPQAAGASNIRELQQQQNTFAADVYQGLASAEGSAPSRETWERNFLRHYPELEGDVSSIDRAWTIAQEASRIFDESGGRKPMPAVVAEVMGEIRGLGVTGIKNRMVDIERRKRNLPAAMEAARRAWKGVWDEAMRYMDENPQAQDELIERLRQDPFTMMRDRETAMLLQRQIDLENRHDSAVERVNKAWDSTDESARTVAKAEAQAAETALLEIYDLGKAAGTRLGQGLAARKMLGHRDYTLGRMIAEARAAKGGESLTELEAAELEATQQKIVETTQAFDEHVAGKEFDEAGKAVDDTIAELKEQAKVDTEVEPEVQSLVDRIRARLQKAEDEARARLSKKFNQQLGSVPDVTIVSDLAIIAASKIGKGVLKFSEFAAQMIKDFGKGVEPYLQKAWDEADRKLEQTVKASAPREKRAQVKKEVKAVDQAELRERTMKNAEKRMQKEGASLNDLRAYVQKLALSFVRSGITEREPLVDAVHAFVEQLDVGASRRQTMDLISGYGDFAKLDPEAAKVQLRDIKGQLQQLAKIDDITNKRELLKSGVERRTLSHEERAMVAAVNEAKRKFGVVTTDPSRQLKSSLDTIKTRLRNQLHDLTTELETGVRRPEKTKVEYDADAARMAAVRDRVRATLDELEGKPEMTDDQRLQIAMRSVEQSIAEYTRRIDTKDFSGERRGAKTPDSAVLDAMKARRDALKSEFEELRALDEAWQEERTFDSLMKQADTIAEKLKTGDTAPAKPDPKAPDTDLVASAREHLTALRKQMAAARKSSPEARAAQLEAAVKAVERSIAEYDKRIQTGAIDPITRKPAATSPKLDRLKAERDEMRKFVADLRAQAKPKLTWDEVALKALKTRLKNENAELLKKMAAGDFSKKVPRKLDLSKDPEAVKLKAANNRVKEEFEKRKLLWERDHRTRYETLLARAGEVLNVPRAVMSSMDVSAVLRQGGWVTFGNPGKAVTAMKRMAESMISEDGFQTEKARLELDPQYQEAKQAGLFQAESGDVRLTAMEEARMSELAEKIPGVRMSNRAYIGFLNRIRFDSYKAMTASLTRGGIFRRAGQGTLKEQKAIANYVNIATGRGNLGSAAKAAQVLATVFFSPRLLVSRFQLLAGPLSGFRFGGGSMRTRQLIAKEYAKTLTGLGIIYGLAAWSGATVEVDPRSADFGKLRIGNTRIDLLMGLAQVSTFLGKVSTGEAIDTRTGKVSDMDRMRTTGRFLQSKFAPLINQTYDAANLLTGKRPRFGGPKDWEEFGWSMAPLSFQDVNKIMQEHGVPAGTALQLLAMLGAGIQIHEQRRKRDRD
jgi:hypothetical protein